MKKVIVLLVIFFAVGEQCLPAMCGEQAHSASIPSLVTLSLKHISTIDIFDHVLIPSDIVASIAIKKFNNIDYRDIERLLVRFLNDPECRLKNAFLNKAVPLLVAKNSTYLDGIGASFFASNLDCTDKLMLRIGLPANNLANNKVMLENRVEFEVCKNLVVRYNRFSSLSKKTKEKLVERIEGSHLHKGQKRLLKSEIEFMKTSSEFDLFLAMWSIFFWWSCLNIYKSCLDFCE